MSRDQAISQYYDLFDSHVSAEFSSQTSILDLLKTKGLQVFVPDNWNGISGVTALDIKFKDSLPERLKPKARPINPRLWENAEKEFFRMKTYFYQISRSPWASCLVVAPKATKPFIRLCGDYVEINKHLPTGHYNIPRVKHELDRIIDFQLYLDIDLTNAFHQVPLNPDTAEKLSIQTPWGQFQPKFMPEGIGPGSGVLQETVRTLFSDFASWAILIFDNILILAKSYQDGYEKLETFLDRCIKHNVALKFSKSWLGFREVNFFGYLCKHKSYELTEDRKKALDDIPFPESGNRVKKMRSMLGSGVFFAPFVHNYSNHVKHLTDLSKDSFNWDESTWKYDYREEFLEYKAALKNACAVYFPDYTLDWIVRTDASELGIGGVLVQLKNNEEQILALVSKKFSDPATRWSTIEQEAFGLYYVVKILAYYLVGKEFVLETDHNNLRWMESSEVPKIIRQRIYLQSFVFLIRHIAGKLNVLPDTLSRLFLLYGMFDPFEEEGGTVQPQLCNLFSGTDDNNDSMCSPGDESEGLLMTKDQMIHEIHNYREGHWGEKETWRRLNKYFPGHSIPFARVADFVSMCATCQKTRREMSLGLKPIIRNLKPPHSRSAIGIDAVEITPHGANGQTHINVVVNLFTKLTYLYPGVTADNLIATVWSYWCNFGHTDMIISDLGPDLNSKMFKGLVDLMGMLHKFSIANRHVNGCERRIKEVARHLRAIVFDKRLKDVFDDVNIIPSVQHVLNSAFNSETGACPFELSFGTEAVLYNELLVNGDSKPSHLLLKRLNDNLKIIRDQSAKYQQDLVNVREIHQDVSKQNKYQAGDFVMYDKGPKAHPKLSARYKGPHVVINQYKNDVQCKNLITGGILTYSVSDLEPFFGSHEQAFDAATRDQDQYLVECILSYSGDCNSKSKMWFKVKYVDGDIVDVPWSMDLQCEAYYIFCESRPYLTHLSMDTKMAASFKAQKSKLDITSVSIGDTVYIDLRFFGDEWYENIGLPDCESMSYVMLFKYTHFFHKSSKKKISGIFVLTGYKYSLTGYLVYAWGSVRDLQSDNMVLVDQALIDKYPRIVE